MKDVLNLKSMVTAVTVVYVMRDDAGMDTKTGDPHGVMFSS